MCTVAGYGRTSSVLWSARYYLWTHTYSPKTWSTIRLLSQILWWLTWIQLKTMEKWGKKFKFSISVWHRERSPLEGSDHHTTRDGKGFYQSSIINHSDVESMIRKFHVFLVFTAVVVRHGWNKSFTTMRIQFESASCKVLTTSKHQIARDCPTWNLSGNPQLLETLASRKKSHF